MPSSVDRDSEAGGLFTVDPVSGVIRTRAVLNHEDRSIYRLQVAATDAGFPPRQTVRVLRVEVLDVNDNRGTFTSSSLVFQVSRPSWSCGPALIFAIYCLPRPAPPVTSCSCAAVHWVHSSQVVDAPCLHCASARDSDRAAGPFPASLPLTDQPAAAAIPSFYFDRLIVPLLSSHLLLSLLF